MNEKRNQLLKIGSIVIVLLVLFYFAIKSNQKQSVYRYTDSAMSTAITFQLYGTKAEQQKDEMIHCIRDLENNISWRISSSKIAKLNQAGELRIEDEIDATVKKWIGCATELGLKSDGALDISVLPLAKLWNIESISESNIVSNEIPNEIPNLIPTKDEILKAQKKCGLEKVKITEDKIELDSGTEIDLGAIGKGIALDQLYNLENFVGTVSVGGSILVRGQKPDGTDWKLGIQDPRGNTGDAMGVFLVDHSCMLSTSGDYEKYFEKNGKRYHHILDSKTGYPSDSDLISVSIIFTNIDKERSDMDLQNGKKNYSNYSINESGDDVQGLLSDGLSTACFVLGKDKGIELIGEYKKKYSVEAIFIDKNSSVYITDGLKNSFVITNDNYHLEK